MELEENRFDASTHLRNAIYEVLDRKNIFTKVLYKQLDLKLGNMTKHFPAIGTYTHIFFNNFGIWFTSDKHKEKKSINHLFEDALARNMCAGAQVNILFNSL